MPGSATAGLEARRDILTALESGLAIVDVSVTQVSRTGRPLRGRTRKRWTGGAGRRGVPTAGLNPTATR